MIINVAISLGELIDKISILLIKKKNIKDQKKLEFIKQELQILQNTLDQSLDNKKIEFYLNKLISINSQLWKIEDEIRDCERDKNFDQKFIDLARSVYITNDKRSALKLEINNLFGSKLVEVKSYEKY
jgi:hypothetical protein|tara:strand:+ start:133 stop:516 length:384 start_codon:yes stop_codon:yes gene_type:complete